MRYFLTLAVVLPLLLTACADEASDPQLQVEDFQYQMLPGGARIISGKLLNNGETTVSNAQLQVSLFDADNRRVSSMIILVQDVEPGAAKSFREPIDSDLDIRGARVRSVLVM
jgi:hypothetical protein